MPLFSNIFIWKTSEHFPKYIQTTVQLEDVGTVKKMISHNPVAKTTKTKHISGLELRVLYTWTPVSSGGLCPLDTERGLSMSSRPLNVLHMRNLWLKTATEWSSNGWSLYLFISLKDKVMVVADKFNSRYTWIQCISKVITLWTENSFKGVWILRGWQVEELRPWKAESVTPLWLCSFCEWSSLLSTLANKAGACVTQVTLQLGSWLLVKSVASRPAEVKRGHTLHPWFPL